MSDDPQDQAEVLDEEIVDGVDDYSGDEYGEGLPEYPPDRPLGVNTVGVTPVEEDAGESFAERTEREQPDFGERRDDEADGADPGGGEVGQTVDPTATAEDREEQAVADALPGDEPGPEAAALHIEEEPG